MSKADITIYAAPTYIAIDYDRDGSLAGSRGLLPATLFTDHLQVTDPSEGTVTHEFYYIDEAARQIRLPYYCQEDCISLAKAKGLTVHVVDLKLHDGVDVDIPMIDGFKPKNERQAETIAFTTDPKNGHRRAVALQPGAGKALVNNTPVRVPGGWTEIGKLKVGDEVIAYDGTISKVTGVYPQGRIPAIHVIIGDGRFCTTNPDHLWGCYVDGGIYEVLTTETIRKLVKEDNRTVTIPVCIPQDIPDVPLPLPPEELGRRTRASGDITDELLEPIVEASPRQKRAFLEGLCEQADSRYEFSAQVDRYYSLALIDLIRSLGYRAYYEDETLSWDTSARTLKIGGFVTSTPCQMTCISIDHPDKLFVIRHYIATHNTVTLINTASILHKRVLVQMAGNIDQWGEAILKWTKCSPEDIYIIRGAATMRKLVTDIDEINPKFIIASTRTLISFQEFCDKHRETMEHNGFPSFDNLLEHFGVGIWGIDEYHYNIEANFGLGLRWKCPVVIPMTATFLNANPKVLAVLDRQYPPETRYGYGKYHKYVHICAVRYSLKMFVNRFVYQGAKGYSHAGVEDFIRRKHMTTFVDFVIWPVMERIYLKIRNEGEKFLILCTTVEFVDTLIEVLKKKLQAEGINLRIGALYGGVDEEEVKSSNDILVATLKKGGTGSDIPMLRSMINTVAVKSITENEQNLGRLRELPDKSIDPIYAYLTWDDIPPQVEYFLPRMKHYSRLGKTFNVFRIGNQNSPEPRKDRAA